MIWVVTCSVRRALFQEFHPQFVLCVCRRHLLSLIAVSGACHCQLDLSIFVLYILTNRHCLLWTIDSGIILNARKAKYTLRHQCDKSGRCKGLDPLVSRENTKGTRAQKYFPSVVNLVIAWRQSLQQMWSQSVQQEWNQSLQQMTSDSASCKVNYAKCEVSLKSWSGSLLFAVGDHLELFYFIGLLLLLFILNYCNWVLF